VDVEDLDFALPPEAIAQKPAERRDESRLLYVSRRTGELAHLRFRDLPDALAGPHAFIRNNARVLRARLPGLRVTGGKVECLLLEPATGDHEWWCLLRPGKRLPAGARFSWPGAYEAEVLEAESDGRRRVRFHPAPTLGDMGAVAGRIGRLPLPPYIDRAEDEANAALDAERYQTVYADATRAVAVAAPTAGLHFTPELITRLERAGHTFHDLTLHVGMGTFRPIQSGRVEDHTMHRETYEMPASVHTILSGSPTPRIAVGTTSLRAWEDWRKRECPPLPAGADVLHGSADIFITPPYTFGAEGLLTNFHLPRSTLLCLVSAFLAPGETTGLPWLKELYAIAIREGYRFFSYGDAMLITD
jgi:S-adenosylmethionine:tRNA ribosyltransferase-isomerase